MLCDSFSHGYLLAELHSPFLEKNSKHHDAVKNTNATFGWGTKSGKEYLELEPRMSLVSETSYNEEMKKHTIYGKESMLYLPSLQEQAMTMEYVNMHLCWVKYMERMRP